VLYTPAADDSEGQARSAAFLQGLQQLGWTDGRTLTPIVLAQSKIKDE